MKIGDKIYNRETNKHTHITDINGQIIWIFYSTGISTPCTKSNFIKFYITEKNLRKQKLFKILNNVNI